MTDPRPAPYPADTRSRGWRFELDVERAYQSDTWALAGPQLRPWLLMLWVTAWQQCPCGSLPNDDRLIAAHLGMGREEFERDRDVLMRGWWLADDGRLYHDIIATRVSEMRDKREAERKRKADFRAKKDAERAAAKPPDGADLPPNVPRDSGGTDAEDAGTLGGTDDTRTRTRTSREEIQGAPAVSVGDQSAALKALGSALARAGVDMAQVNLGDPAVLQLLAKGATPEEFCGLMLEAQRGHKRWPWRWVLSALPGRRDDAQSVQLAQPPPVTVPSDDADRTQAMLAAQRQSPAEREASEAARRRVFGDRAPRVAAAGGA